MKQLFHLGMAAAALQAGAWAEATAAHTLFNPVPRDEMRPLHADRPDKTESPYTLDAGHFQIETSFVEFVWDRRNAEHERRFDLNAANMNLKAGLTDWADFQLLLDNYLYERVHSGDGVERRSGFGDVTTRLKINLWGNDSGDTAFGVMPWVKWPSATGGFGNGRVEGGVILPFAAKLPWEFGLGAMLEVNAVARDGSDYGVDFVQSLTVGRELFGPVSGYVEIFNQVPDTGRDVAVSFDCGLTWKVTDDLQFDAGVNIGLTRAADDFNPFTGMTLRF